MGGRGAEERRERGVLQWGWRDPSGAAVWFGVEKGGEWLLGGPWSKALAAELSPRNSSRGDHERDAAGPSPRFTARGKKCSRSVSAVQAAAAVFFHPELSTHTAHRKVDAWLGVPEQKVSPDPIPLHIPTALGCESHSQAMWAHVALRLQPCAHPSTERALRPRGARNNPALRC